VVEPVPETDGAETRLVARSERLIGYLDAEIARMGICDRRAGIMGCAQESSHEFVDRHPVGAGDLDRAVQRGPELGDAATTSCLF
jgi:hypothetical protein